LSRRETLAIIPARGGSKGIPRKNIFPVGGRPLISYTIEAAKKSASVTRAIVSTDSEEIASVAREWGAEVVRRPAELSGDTASSESALIHTVRYLEESENYVPELLVFLQATSPLRTADQIEACIAQLDRDAADSLFSACRSEGFLWRVSGGEVHSFNYDYRNRPRRQEAPQDVVENGAIYVLKPWILQRQGCRLGGKISFCLMPALDSFQIDELEDVRLVESLLLHR
jgi:CMP-N,N'-diacetyllegionaminic acid synthase